MAYFGGMFFANMGGGGWSELFSTSGKNPKIFFSRQKNQSQLWIPRKPRKIGVWVSGAEIQTSAVDTRTAVWVSTPEKFSKIVLGKTRNFSALQLWIKTRLLLQCSATPATVAATPPCRRTPFQTQTWVRHLPAQGGGGATPNFYRGV